MTNKKRKAVVNNIDVTDCKLLIDETESGTRFLECKAHYLLDDDMNILEFDLCEDHPNCPVKRLKRALEALEVAKEALETYSELYIDTEACDDEFFGASAQWALQKIKELTDESDIK